MRTIVYCISIVIEWKVEYKFLIEEFLIKNLHSKRGVSLEYCEVLVTSE